jgi:hypothetical protein
LHHGTSIIDQGNAIRRAILQAVAGEVDDQRAKAIAFIVDRASQRSRIVGALSLPL